MPLRHPGPDCFLECVETVRKTLGRLPNQMRRPVRIDRQRAVVREARVYLLGELGKFVSEVGYEPGGIVR